MEYRRNISEPNSLPFFLWFADIFTKTLIDHLCLTQISIDEETVDSLGNLMTQNGISIMRLIMKKSTFGTAENCARLLSEINPKYVTLLETDFLAMNFILTDSVSELLPSLKELDVDCGLYLTENTTSAERMVKEIDLYTNARLLTLPDRVQQLPNVCRLSFACIVDFKIIKRKIHRLFFGGSEEEDAVYVVSLAGKFCDNNAILEALELPELEWSIDDSGHLVIWISGLDRLLLVSQTGKYSEMSDAFEWEFNLR